MQRNVSNCLNLPPTSPCFRATVPSQTLVRLPQLDLESKGSAKGKCVSMGRIGVVQMCSSEDVDSNYQCATRLCAMAAAQGVELLSFPECFAFMGLKAGASARMAESLNGPLLSRYRDLAVSHKLWLSLGGFHELSTNLSDKRIHNTHLLLDDTGATRAVYRKLHLYDADAGSSGKYRESEGTAAGPSLGAVALNTPVGPVGLTTCYDVRFPYVYAALRDVGCKVLLVPSAFMPTTGKAHWEVLLRARAVENQCYVAAAAQVGLHAGEQGGRESYGHAMIIDAWGKVLVDAGVDKECIVVADVDDFEVERIRERMPVVQHRRDHSAGPVVIFP
ncbi:unnamed protein product [Choristocarpus tenellus]